MIKSKNLVKKNYLNFFTKYNRCISTNIAINCQKLSYLNNLGSKPLVYRNFAEQIELNVKNFGDNEALVSCHENKRYTFSEVLQKIDRLAAAFYKIGLKRGDRIGIWTPNSAEWYLSMLAAARGGFISVGLNPVYQGPEIEYCMKKVGVKALITTERFQKQNYLEILNNLFPNLNKLEPGRVVNEQMPCLQNIIIDSNKQHEGTLRFDDLFDLPSSEEIADISKIHPKISPDEPLNIQFTSGTTGKPKAAVLSHNGIVNNAIHIGERNELNTKHHRICCQVPLFHAFGITISVSTTHVYGTTLVLPSAGFKPEESLKTIVNEKCTIIHGTPTMYVDLINKQKELNYKLETAEIAVTGGSPCSPKLFQDIKNVLNLKKVKTVYGMTENTAVSFQSKPDTTDDQVLNTVGHLTDNLEAKVVDNNNNLVPFGQPGELCIRGYCIMLEYFNDPSKTKEICGNDRWLRTGDQFVLHENGYGQIVGRIKEMIIRGGENIFPKEIEDFLNTHPNIIENYVIGVPDERLGEEVCAYIRLHNSSDNLDHSDISEFCKGKIAHFKIPKHIKIVQSFPKTVSGKIQKFKLKALFDNSK